MNNDCIHKKEMKPNDIGRRICPLTNNSTCENDCGFYEPMKEMDISRPDVRKKVFEESNGKCAYCGTDITSRSMVISHKNPNDGINANDENYDNYENYLPSCKACSLRKGELPLEAFRSQLKKTTDVLLHDNADFRQAVRFHQINIVDDNEPIVFYFEKKN